MFDKKSLSETDIRTKYITPAIVNAGWNPMSQMREEYAVTKGRIIARGKTCKREAPLNCGKERGSKDAHHFRSEFLVSPHCEDLPK